MMQRPVLHLRHRGQLQAGHQPVQLALERGPLVVPEIEAEALVQRFEQQVGLELLGRQRRIVEQAPAQCSHTRISDSSCATSTGLVM